MKQTASKSRRLGLAAAALGVAALVAACGGAGGHGNDGAGAASSTSAGLKMAACMRSHGVPDFPDPSSSSGGTQIQQSSNNGSSSISVDGVTLNVSAPAFQKAMQECQKDQPQGPALSSSQLASVRKGALAMAKCMRAHGVPNFPDPQVTTGPGGHGVGIKIGVQASGSGGAGALNPQSPAFQAAQKVCQPLMAASVHAIHP